FYFCSFVFFFQAEDGIRDGHVTGVQTCALPICGVRALAARRRHARRLVALLLVVRWPRRVAEARGLLGGGQREEPVERSRRGVEDRKSTRLNSSHVAISYAVFGLKKKMEYTQTQ